MKARMKNPAAVLPEVERCPNDRDVAACHSFHCTDGSLVGASSQFG